LVPEFVHSAYSNLNQQLCVDGIRLCYDIHDGCLFDTGTTQSIRTGDAIPLNLDGGMNDAKFATDHFVDSFQNRIVHRFAAAAAIGRIAGRTQNGTMYRQGRNPMRNTPNVQFVDIVYPLHIGNALSEWGGKNAVLIISDGEWYRLITPIMLHAGIFHLIGNVAVQLETGVFFEREWGSIRWLIVYLGSAVGSTVFSVIVMPNAVSVGSSGAVMGLFGGKLAEVLLRCCERQITKQDQVAATVRKEQCCVVTFSVILVMAFSFIPFVDWAAHLGGLVAGFVIGLALFSFAVQGCYGVWKIVWLSLGLAAASAFFIGTITYMYSGQVEAAEELRDVCGYYKENFENYECNCMRDEYVQNGGN
jgi:membrane associated rhomboid family serine protease